jgi:RNA polymerase sigma-70 factor (ECF subfamily)
MAEDVFQNTFLRVHARRHLYGKNRRVRPWLYTIATHQAIDALRKEGRQASISLNEKHSVDGSDLGTLLNLLEAKTPTPVERLIERERREWTRRAVDALPDHQRVVILLIYFQGLKYGEVAEILEMPVGTVKSRVHKALLALNQAWQDDHPS